MIKRNFTENWYYQFERTSVHLSISTPLLGDEQVKFIYQKVDTLDPNVLNRLANSIPNVCNERFQSPNHKGGSLEYIWLYLTQ